MSVFALTASCAIAADEPKPTLPVCKSGLKAWSAQKTDSLTLDEINARMNEMVACANLTKKHEKKMRAYLDEFYRTHSELAGRAFDFITDHGLTEEFSQEKSGKKKASDNSDTDSDNSTI